MLEMLSWNPIQEPLFKDNTSVVIDLKVEEKYKDLHQLEDLLGRPLLSLRSCIVMMIIR